ncbi:hypothetical protein PCANC_00002 [Puccinia coronata f. sp. avenae]|uniref:Uncharacterized protein n=1 Tax=Puccinia coronata f. sp. avenae TaxID=200324 RepID=A0A2N5W8H3_9BASI|nr:hypothetical protein PCANC_00002 [Puccinia coronata f. sp. avenae]
MWVKINQPSGAIPAVGSTVDNPTRQPSQKLPSTIFAIPFPRPNQYHEANIEAHPYLLYTFPRSVYEKPPKDPVTGKPGKEKLVKKFERKWQQEVKEGRDMKKGRHKDAGRFKRSKGAVVRFAASTIQWLPNNVMEVLARLPPPRKIGKVSIIYPESVDMAWFNSAILNETRIEESFWDLLTDTKKKAKTRIALSGCLLPITLAIDIFVIIPLFIFEINLAYFVTLLNGSRKAKHFVETNKPASQTTSCEQVINPNFEFKAYPGSRFTKTTAHLYSICSTIDPIRFPLLKEVPPLNHTPQKDIAADLIQIFKESLESNVTSRHVLDEDLVALDLDRALRKAAKEYVKKLT